MYRKTPIPSPGSLSFLISRKATIPSDLNVEERRSLGARLGFYGMLIITHVYAKYANETFTAVTEKVNIDIQKKRN